MKMKWVVLGATMALALGCAPDLQSGTGGSGGSGTGTSTSSSSTSSNSGSSSGSNVCALGQSTVGNCVLGP